jgi:hypothetical protein
MLRSSLITQVEFLSRVLAVALAYGLTVGRGTDVLGADPQQVTTTQAATITVTPEKISEAASGCSVHGWHSSRLVKYQGTIYAIVVTGEVESGAIMRRDKHGAWTQVAQLPYEPYTLMVDPLGRFWVLGYGPRSCQVYRSGEKGDLSRWEKVYEADGASHGHSAAGMSPEGNVLVMHQGGKKGGIACTAAFYDAQTDTWHESKITGTPEIERRYAYEAIMMHGKEATVVMGSYKAYGPDGNSYNVVGPDANSGKMGLWRYIRVARCQDLTKGQWEHKLIAGKRWGQSTLTDVYQARDGRIYLTYRTRGGETQEEFDKDSMRPYLAVIGRDLSVEIKALDYLPGGARFHVDSTGRFRLVGERNKELRVWDADLSNELVLSNERRLPGIEMFTGYMLHTLRPQRFGGEGDDNFIYVYSTDTRDKPQGPTQPLWFLAVPVSQTRK